MLCAYNLNTSFNGFSYPFKHPVFKTNFWIPLSHYSTGVIDSTDTKIKQNRFFREVYINMGAKHLFSDVLWTVDKQFVA